MTGTVVLGPQDRFAELTPRERPAPPPPIPPRRRPLGKGAPQLAEIRRSKQLGKIPQLRSRPAATIATPAPSSFPPFVRAAPAKSEPANFADLPAEPPIAGGWRERAPD